MGSFLSVFSQLGWIISWIRVTGRQLLARLHMLWCVGEFFHQRFRGLVSLAGGVECGGVPLGVMPFPVADTPLPLPSTPLPWAVAGLFPVAGEDGGVGCFLRSARELG